MTESLINELLEGYVPNLKDYIKIRKRFKVDLKITLLERTN